MFTEKMAMTECIRGLSKLFVEQLNINLQRQRRDLQSATQSLSNENGNTLTLPSTARTTTIATTAGTTNGAAMATTSTATATAGGEQQQQQQQASVGNPKKRKRGVWERV